MRWNRTGLTAAGSRRMGVAGGLAATAAFLAGCGEAWHAETYPATGKVLVNGVPATDALVELRPTGPEKPDSRNSRPWGIVQADGTYVLTTYAKGDGAPAGEYALTLRWPSDVSSMSHFDRLSGKYDSPEEAPVKVTIGADENTLPAVELTDVKVLPADKPTGGKRKRMPGPGPGR